MTADKIAQEIVDTMILAMTQLGVAITRETLVSKINDHLANVELRIDQIINKKFPV